MWFVYALLAALFGGITSIFAKIGVENVNSNLATAIRTVVVLIMAWGIVFATGKHQHIADINFKSWLFLVLSGFATGFSWLFFYKALQLGNVVKVIPIDKLSLPIGIFLAFVILGETMNLKSLFGCVLMIAGTFLIAF